MFTCLCCAIFSGCATSRVYLPAYECQGTVDSVRSYLNEYESVGDFRLIKGFASFEDFKMRYCEGHYPEKSADNPYGQFRITGYSKTEAEMKEAYHSLLADPVMDPNKLVNRFSHIRLAQGFVLDFAYNDDERGSFPVLLARRSNTPPVDDWSAFLESYDSKGGFHTYYLSKHRRCNPDYLDSLETDRALMSFFELAVLIYIGEDFYRTWHATWKDRIFCTVQSFDKWEQSVRKWEESTGGDFVLSPRPPEGVANQIRNQDLRPYVEAYSNRVIVSFVSLDDSSGVRRRFWTFTNTVARREGPWGECQDGSSERGVC